MRRLLRKILLPFFTWLADKFSAAPKQADVFKSLSQLYKVISKKDSSRGIVINIDPAIDNFIILSDQHKGTKNYDDDFLTNEINFNAALNYYHNQCYSFINLGDAEELWKNNPEKVITAYPEALQAEVNFQTDNKYYRTFGNHDVLWKSNLDVVLFLKNVFKMPLPVYEGIILRTINTTYPSVDIYCTHGHQGDTMSDNNAFSTWVIAHIWAPIQGFLRINVNTPANDYSLRNKHNRMMYEWSSKRKNIILITGHTHKPVFASGKYTQSDIHKIETPETANKTLPTYFNSGCCCFNDGDITGIEIASGFIRLIKWHNKNGVPERSVLEEKPLSELAHDMND
ncbi:MAG: metallophosphoesterase [Ferruginibacter sp.]